MKIEMLKTINSFIAIIEKYSGGLLNCQTLSTNLKDSFISIISLQLCLRTITTTSRQSNLYSIFAIANVIKCLYSIEIVFVGSYTLFSKDASFGTESFVIEIPFSKSSIILVKDKKAYSCIIHFTPIRTA